MWRRLAAGALLALGLVLGARADTLPLPAALAGFASHDGETYFAESDAREAYFPLASNFLTQATPAFCGVASIVMVLNALAVPAPPAPEYGAFSTFTQDNVFTPATEAILPRETLAKQGMTLDQLGAILSTKPLKAEVRHASDSSIDEFRATASAALGQRGHFVIVNYLRKAIGQQVGGHISPLGAYDAKTDRFLVLDVARYKYPPFWVKTGDIFAAMDTPDSVSGRSRGYVTVAAAPVQ